MSITEIQFIRKVTFEMSFNVFSKVLTNEYELIAKETLYARNIYFNILTSLFVVSICPSKDRINF